MAKGPLSGSEAKQGHRAERQRTSSARAFEGRTYDPAVDIPDRIIDLQKAADAEYAELTRLIGDEHDAQWKRRCDDLHVQCSCDGVCLGRHTLRADTLVSMQLPFLNSVQE